MREYIHHIFKPYPLSFLVLIYDKVNTPSPPPLIHEGALIYDKYKRHYVWGGGGGGPSKKKKKKKNFCGGGGGGGGAHLTKN